MKFLSLGCLVSTAVAGLALDFDIEINDLSKRDGLVLIDLSNQRVFYITSLTVGSLAQQVKVVVDTGSSDSWVMATGVLCVSKRDENMLSKRDCTSFGTFNPQDSTTFKNSNNPFSIVYGDHTKSVGTFGTDTVGFSNVAISNFSLAVVTQTSVQQGVLGLGLTNPLNIPYRLKSEGAIAKSVYSLYLNEKSLSSGSILFGAVDHAKYTGVLATVPVVRTANPTAFAFLVNGFVLDTGGLSVDISNTPQAAILDSGTSLSYVTEDMLTQLVQAVAGVYSSSASAYIVGCDTTGTLNINFSGTSVQVPVSDLILPLDSTRCFLGVFAQTLATSIILGDNILRSLYVVYDLEEKELSIGQAKYTTDTDIEDIISTVPTAGSASTKAPTINSSQATLNSTSVIVKLAVQSLDLDVLTSTSTTPRSSTTSAIPSSPNSSNRSIADVPTSDVASLVIDSTSSIVSATVRASASTSGSNSASGSGSVTRLPNTRVTSGSSVEASFTFFVGLLAGILFYN